MEVLALQLAELLEITVDKAIELYPVLRSQFIVYKMTSIGIFFGALAFFPLAMVSLLVYFEDDWTPKKRAKSITILTSSLGLVVISQIIRYMFATDLMIMLEFL